MGRAMFCVVAVMAVELASSTNAPRLYADERVGHARRIGMRDDDRNPAQDVQVGAGEALEEPAAPPGKVLIGTQLGTSLVEKDNSAKVHPSERVDAAHRDPLESAMDGTELKLPKDVGFAEPAALKAGAARKDVVLEAPPAEGAAHEEKPAAVSHKTWRKMRASHTARKFIERALRNAEHDTLIFVDFISRHLGGPGSFASVNAPGYANEVDANAGTGSLIISLGIACLAIVVYVVARYRDATKQPGFLMFMFCCMFASLIFLVIAIAGFVLRMSK